MRYLCNVLGQEYIFASKSTKGRFMISGFYSNSESVCGLRQKNALANSSMLFLSTMYFPFSPVPQLLFSDPLSQSYFHWEARSPHCPVSCSPHLFVHFPTQLLAPRHLLRSQLFATYSKVLCFSLQKHHCSTSMFLIPIFSIFYSLSQNFFFFFSFTLLVPHHWLFDLLVLIYPPLLLFLVSSNSLVTPLPHQRAQAT